MKRTLSTHYIELVTEISPNIGNGVQDEKDTRCVMCIQVEPSVSLREATKLTGTLEPFCHSV